MTQETVATRRFVEGEGLNVELFQRLVFTRRFLEKVDTLYRQGRVRGPAHLGLGQEAIAVGVGSLLRPGDRSIGTYRGHAHALARGASPESMLRELLGREGGICAGKGGSMHITSVEHGYYGSYAIVGAHLTIANGLAWADQIQRNDAVTVCFFGDGTVNIGAFHEAVTLAAVWKLPVVFVCENNQYMEYTPISAMIPTARPAADKAAAYGMTSIVVDGNDLTEVRRVIGAAIEDARCGRGPALVEADTYRLKGHSAADAGKYRPAEEVERWRARDPLLVYREQLIAAELLDDSAADQMWTDARDELNALTEVVLKAPPPDASGAWTDLWSDGSSSWRN
ncbi:thiamine pyrophosphate-dependent dehydrogenase E1 component subunit alpha [Nocardioides marmoriginsengisoli]|uniref:thiamine pyrophosphate-dependent dehydrogenase E1 component subunit alpha n=1 Tax=Nocardioides marmoriginsengisoli TaxID=661483 RepID=UPI001C829ED6|nr:thiamine pyrophosphate-dependent dehydrogenase E1 component subunit alpha [Nocardioides marmoriginsengisoli]